MESSVLLKYLLLGFGWINLALGIVGVFLPVMPTVPFLLVAAYCFSKSSRRWHDWLRKHPKFGGAICDWEDHRAIKPRTKIIATVMIGIMMCYAFLFSFVPLTLRISMALLLVGVVIFIWSCPPGPSASKPP